MRLGCVAVLCTALLSGAQAAEHEFPYAAYVARRETVVRSGAGRNFYATDSLTIGDTVEVYQHEGDWCAIRPPAGSFSWVKAEDLQIGRDGLGMVLVEGAASRIGSSTSDLRDVIQVRLQRGEQVEVLDAVQVSNDNGVEFFCKISPPSGEFRWVHKDDLSREPPAMEETVGPPHRHEPANAVKASDRGNERSNDRSPPTADRWGSWVRSRGGHLVSAANHAAPDEPVRASAAPVDQPASVPLTPRPSPAASSPSQPEAKVEMFNSVESINRGLSAIIVQEPSKWNLDGVRVAVDEALKTAVSEVDRTSLRALQERIAKFDDVRRRSLALGAPAAAAPAQSGISAVVEIPAVVTAPPANRAALESSTATAPEANSGRYDGIGKLTRVVSQRPNAPRYALVNRGNEVVSFVTPAPGVNLHPFEGQYIGVSGQRGYMPELKKPHVTALRVNSLEPTDARVARRR